MSGEFKFKSTGNSVSKEVENINFSNNIDVFELPLGIKTPLEKGALGKESLFKMHFSLEDQIDDNLKNLLLTKKGERLGFSDFGTNLKKIYSLKNKDDVQEIAMEEIRNSIQKYMPFINLIEFQSKEEKNSSNSETIIILTLKYNILSLSKQQRSITIKLKTSG
jgi:phage baseplate assembly protein W